MADDRRANGRHGRRGEVEQLAWPAVEPLGDEPPVAGREPRNRDSAEWGEWKQTEKVRAAWVLHGDLLRARAVGRAYGFVARFHATKNGLGVGWGEGRCTRGETSKVAQEDYALSSMAQTRAQSRALGAPLKFVVKLAGYETTPAEEFDATPNGSGPAATAGPVPWGPVADDEHMQRAADSVRAIAGDTVPVEAEQFVMAMGQHFDGVPEACVVMLRGLARFISDARARTGDTPPENAPEQPSSPPEAQP